MNFRKIVYSLGLLWWTSALFGQTSIQQRVVDLGMEEVAVARTESATYLTWEDNVYRGSYRGLYEVICSVLNSETDSDIYLVVQEDRFPQLEVCLRQDVMDDYRRGDLSLSEVMQTLELSRHTDASARQLKGAKRVNRMAGKVDLVLDPYLSLTNAWMDKIYGVQFDLAPTLRIGLWKGATFTGQVILPVWNNMTGQMDYVRPGTVTIRQELRLPKNIFASVSVGNFSNYRMGVDGSLQYRTDDDRWGFGLNGGLTGYSTFYNGDWKVSKWKQVTGAAWVRYTEPHYNMDFDVRAIRCIFGDMGAMADCTRHFGEVSIGFYAMITDGEVNGGFHFCVPLSPRKQMKCRAFRVALPEYFPMRYEAQSGNEYAARRLGRFYHARPDDGRSDHYYNPDYIQDNLIRLAKQEKRTK